MDLRGLYGRNHLNIKEATAFYDDSARHAYDVQVTGGRTIRVEANNRSSASARARKAGHEVMSVNMVG